MAESTLFGVKDAGDKVKSVADAVQKVRKKLSQWQVADTVKMDDLDPKKHPIQSVEDFVAGARKWAEWNSEVAQTIAKPTGVVALWIMEYITRGIDKVLVDNPVLRAMEDKFTRVKVPEKSQEERWFARFIKNVPHHVTQAIKDKPALASYLSYYMLMTAVVFGGASVAKGEADQESKVTQKEAVKTNNEQTAKKQIADKSALRYEEFVQDASSVTQDKTGYVNPRDEQYVKQALEEYWPEIAVGLTELETYRSSPKVHKKEKRATNGLGCTWTYVYNKNKKLIQKANIPGKTKALTKDQNYEQCRRHLIYETLPALKKAIGNKENISKPQAVALVYAGYQRAADMAGIARKISEATTVQQIADAFAYYRGPDVYKEGTLKRRWVCAAYAANVITAKDLLNMDCDAFTALDVNTVYRNGHFILGSETVQYVLGRVRGDKQTVAEFLSDFDMGRKVLAAVNASKDEAKRPVINLSEQDLQAEQSMKTLNEAEKAYKNKEYNKAVELYSQAISQDADNMEAYSSLALVYLRLGDATKSTEYYNKCIQTVREGNKRMNANKSLLMDREIKASSYYNAAMAYEKMAGLYADKGKADIAEKYYKSALGNYKTALENAKLADMDVSRQQIYQKAIDRLEKSEQVQKKSVKKVKRGKAKKVAFASGMQKISENDVLMYERALQENIRS